MAKKVDAAAVAAKRRQQMIILAVGGLLLAGLVMLQAPKVLNHGKNKDTSSSSSSSTTATGPDATTPGTTPATTGTSSATTPATTAPTIPATVTGHGPAAKVAGVLVRSAGAPRADTGQLWTLSRFKVRDPFIPQVADASSASGKAATASGEPGAKTAAGGTAPTTSGTTGIGSVGGTVVPTTVTPPAVAYVTLMVNGRAQQLTLRDVFPQGQPTFVVRAVGKKFVTIGVAGGKFVGGAVVKLKFGQAVTLMNTATGQRFVMKLVYTGAQPEHIASFKTPAATVPATSTTASTAAPKA